MSKVEVSVMSGEEGRFLEWTDESGRWTPYNYYNYRHLFEKSHFVKSDYAALRERYNLHEVGISNDQLEMMSPNVLASYGTRK